MKTMEQKRKERKAFSKRADKMVNLIYTKLTIEELIELEFLLQDYNDELISKLLDHIQQSSSLLPKE